MVARGEVQIGAVDKVVLLHVHSLRVGCLLPLLADSPAWARAPKPYPFVRLLGRERGLCGGQALLLFLRCGDIRVVGRWCLRLDVVPGELLLGGRVPALLSRVFLFFGVGCGGARGCGRGAAVVVLGCLQLLYLAIP